MIRNVQLIRSTALKYADTVPTPVAASDESESRVLSRRLWNRGAASQLYDEAAGFVTRILENLRTGDDISLIEAHPIAAGIFTQLDSNTSLLPLALDRRAPFSIPHHSVNVSIIAARIAQTLGWTTERIQQLALAGLVHDTGVVRLPASLLSKPSVFTRQERLEIRQRPLHSAELLSRQSGFKWLANIVSQVHEREDGSGYPMGLNGSAICVEAKILSVADVFEACLHQRPYRMALTGPETMHMITSDMQCFSEQITKAFIRSFSVYPYNEYVRLNSGETAIVTEINSTNPMRPVLKVLYSPDGNPLPEPKSVDLTRNSQLWISSALAATDLPRSAADPLSRMP